MKSQGATSQTLEFTQLLFATTLGNLIFFSFPLLNTPITAKSQNHLLWLDSI